jgi:hypothetical protein
MCGVSHSASKRAKNIVEYNQSCLSLGAAMYSLSLMSFLFFCLALFALATGASRFKRGDVSIPTDYSLSDNMSEAAKNAKNAITVKPGKI